MNAREVGKNSDGKNTGKLKLWKELGAIAVGFFLSIPVVEGGAAVIDYAFSPRIVFCYDDAVREFRLADTRQISQAFAVLDRDERWAAAKRAVTCNWKWPKIGREMQRIRDERAAAGKPDWEEWYLVNSKGERISWPSDAE